MDSLLSKGTSAKDDREMRLSKFGGLTVTLIIKATAGSTRGAEADSLVLKNGCVLRELRRVDRSWRTVRFARGR